MANQEVYLEQIVKRGTPEKDRLHKILLIVAAVVIAALPFVISLIVSYLAGPVWIMAVALFTWILLRRIGKEYEYIYTSGNLDFDVIYSRTSRRHLATFDCKRCRYIGPAQSEKASAYLQEKADKKILAIPGEIDENTYLLAGTYQEKQYHIYFAPNEKILSELREYAPGVVE